MPFVDYYSLITWKTIAICIFGTEAVSAKFVMKTDDDVFARVDEILASLDRINVNSGRLLYGLINLDSCPHRNPDSKWYISSEEWPEDTYPPWAHGREEEAQKWRPKDLQARRCCYGNLDLGYEEEWLGS
ncbi:unnamed protein product [Fraxinus pennsylvanica]|uniref:Hexosyltransferase n=1 Tax=Fraxinus pennsylvanica TaxID=56036 RepID=A0AAD2DY27_9LAMI|nr:unnamed protein product [Fraxinus pennsylvanica]